MPCSIDSKISIDLKISPIPQCALLIARDLICPILSLVKLPCHDNPEFNLSMYVVHTTTVNAKTLGF